VYHLINFIIFVNHIAIFNEGFLINFQKYLNVEGTFFMEFYLIEPYLIFQNKISAHLLSNPPILLSGGLGKIDYFEKLLKFPNSDVILKKTYVDDNILQNIYLTNISQSNANNNSFHGEILMKLSKIVPDGIICYFSSVSLMEYYLTKWNEQDVFKYIMNEKLLFVEEQDSIRLSNTITNYKKSCDMGRGGILFLSTRNKASLFDNFTNHHSRCIIFIGFPIETKLTKTFELRLENYKKTFDIDSKDFFNYDTFKLFSNKIAEKILDVTDKKILVILDEKLMSDKLKDYLPPWIHKIIHVDFDKTNLNTDERLKNIKKFLVDNFNP
jgi:Rad3-related DNA helicase